jgi:hypothetical protein
MSKPKTPVKPPRPDYPRTDVPPVVVHVIEVVTRDGNVRELEEVLDQLRTYSAAAVVERFGVSCTYDMACITLNKRALPDAY